MLFLDDGAPVRLNVSLAPAAPKVDAGAGKEKAPTPAMFGVEEEEEEATHKCKVPLQSLDFSVAYDSERAKEHLEHIKVWDAVTEVHLTQHLSYLCVDLEYASN
jgi:RNA-binding protein 25